MHSALVYAYMASVGLAAGGIAVSGYRLLTDRPASFEVAPVTLPSAFAHGLVLMFGGPLVIMRSAIRGRLIERRPLPFLAASTVVAALWCFLSGAFLVSLFGRVA